MKSRIIEFLLVAIVILFSFRILVFITNRFRVINDSFKRHWSYIHPILEFLCWIGYLVWVIKSFYLSQDYFLLASIGLIFILILTSLIVLFRDFLSGIFLKVQGLVADGHYIDTGEISGRIFKAGSFRLNIRDNHGTIHSIPYNQIRSNVISKSAENENYEKVILEFQLPPTDNINELASRVKKNVMNTAWAVISQSPEIEDIITSKEHTIIRIAVYSIDSSYAENIQNMIEKDT